MNIMEEILEIRGCIEILANNIISKSTQLTFCQLIKNNKGIFSL